MGRSYEQLSLEERCEIARLRGRGQLDPANRGSSGSRAIDHCSRDKAKSQPAKRLPARLCRTNRAAPGAGPAPSWIAVRNCATSSSRGSANGLSPEQVAGRLAVETGPAGDLPRDDLPVHLRSDRSHQGLQLARTICPAAGPERSSAGLQEREVRASSIALRCPISAAAQERQ